MAHTEPHGPSHGEAVGHETRDASLGGVEKFIVVMAAFLAASFVLMWLMYGYLGGREAALDVPRSPVMPRGGDRLPPVPRLQTVPYRDLAAFRQSENDVLEGWSWVDKGKGIAHIPVSRAIDILAERGLPTPSAPPPAGGTPAPGGAAPTPSTTAAASKAAPASGQPDRRPPP